MDRGERNEKRNKGEKVGGKKEFERIWMLNGRGKMRGNDILMCVIDWMFKMVKIKIVF